MLTKGRTHARPDLAIETLVSATPNAQWHLHKNAEYRKVGQVCAQPRSVAEIAAYLEVPLGVARVLISDLADTGFVRIHDAPQTTDGRPDRLDPAVAVAGQILQHRGALEGRSVGAEQDRK